VLGQKEKTDAATAVGGNSSLADAARTLSETRETLRQFETSALADVARTLAEVAESLAQTTRELSLIQGEEWADAEGIRLHLKRSKKQFERLAPRLPRHYISERGILYNVREVDEWLMAR
jgi:hypothetical protein